MIATVEPNGETKIEHYTQFRDDTLTGAWRQIENILEEGQALGPTEVVAEQFDLRPGNKFMADLTPLKLNAILTVYCHKKGIPIHWQTPAMAKTLVSNTVLKTLGWYLTGKQVGQKDADDVRDAFRHLVYRLAAKEYNKWVLEGGWPSN